MPKILSGGRLIDVPGSSRTTIPEKDIGGKPVIIVKPKMKRKRTGNTITTFSNTLEKKRWTCKNHHYSGTKTCPDCDREHFRNQFGFGLPKDPVREFLEG